MDQLSPQDIALLGEPVIVHLTTLMPDGAPQTTPVWVDVDPDANLILVNTAEGRVKTRNIRRDPRVSVSATAPDDQFRTLSVRGEVVEVTTGGAVEHIDRLAKKYLDVEPYPWHDPKQTRLIVKIRPLRITRPR